MGLVRIRHKLGLLEAVISTKASIGWEQQLFDGLSAVSSKAVYHDIRFSAAGQQRIIREHVFDYGLPSFQKVAHGTLSPVHCTFLSAGNAWAGRLGKFMY